MEGVDYSGAAMYSPNVDSDNEIESEKDMDMGPEIEEETIQISDETENEPGNEPEAGPSPKYSDEERANMISKEKNGESSRRSQLRHKKRRRTEGKRANKYCMEKRTRIKEGYIHIAIIRANYPDRKISFPHGRIIESEIMSLILEGHDSGPITFLGCELRGGAMVVTSSDVSSIEWLVSNVSRCTSLDDESLRTMDVRKLEKRGVFEFYVSNPRDNDTTTLQVLQRQNKEILTDCWRLVGSKIVQWGRFIAVSLPDSQVKILRKSNYKLNYGFKLIRFYKQKDQIVP